MGKGRSVNHKRVRRRRAEMMAADPHCWRCGTEVVYWHEEGGTPHPPDNFATIGHVYSRNIPEEDRPLNGRWELECYRCNQDYGKMEQQMNQLRERYGKDKLPRSNPPNQ